MATVTIYTRVGNQPAQRVTQPIDHPAGKFVLRYKTQWKTLECRTWNEALQAQLQFQIDLLGGEPAPPPPTPKLPSPQEYLLANLDSKVVGRTPLDKAIDTYLANQATKSGKTSAAYNFTMQQFFASATENGLRPRLVEAINRQDMVNFIGFLRATGVGNRTVHNRLSEIGAFLRASGVTGVTELIKSVQVKFVEKKVRAYREDELAAMFRVADPEEHILFSFFLATGAREQEVMYATWRQVDFVDCIFVIDGNRSKDKESKEIPIPPTLVARLKERMLRSTGDLIFPAANGGPDGHMLRKVQALGKRAGIRGTVGLHIFRKTFATRLHRDGIDARSIQAMLGHADLATTLAYLEGESARSEKLRDAVKRSFGVFA